MHLHSFAKSFVVVLPLLGAASCGTTTPTQSKKVTQSADLVDWIEKVHVECEVSSGTVRETLGTLAVLASRNQGDSAAAYAEFVEAIRRSEQQAQKLRSSVSPMRSASEPVFGRWAADLAAYTNPRMRQHSERRLADTRSRFNAIIAAIEPTQAAYETLNMGLRDIALFLGHDLNAAALSEIEGDVRALAQLAAELDGKFGTCLQASRNYMDSRVMPAQPAAPQAPGQD